MSYTELISSKVVKAPFNGFDIGADDLDPFLFPHQKDIILWNVRDGYGTERRLLEGRMLLFEAE